MKEFTIGQKVWRNSVIDDRAEIVVGVITKKVVKIVERFENGSIQRDEPAIYYYVTVNYIESRDAIDPYEWFGSREELIKHMFAGKE